MQRLSRKKGAADEDEGEEGGGRGRGGVEGKKERKDPQVRVVGKGHSS